MSSLNKLLKKDLLVEALKMEESLQNSSTDLIEQLTSRIINLESSLNEFKTRFTQAEDRLFYLENDLIKLQQYSRRENIEIIGIPDSVQQINLEKTVIGILQRIGVKISSYHI